MTIVILKWIVVGLCVLNSGFMLFDGLRALITGDYIRPKTGEYAGKLGPWDKIVTFVGIDPMSGFMKCIFVVFGITGLCIAASFALNYSWSWKAILIYNISASWYLVMGTMNSVIQLILLIVMWWLV